MNCSKFGLSSVLPHKQNRITCVYGIEEGFSTVALVTF